MIRAIYLIKMPALENAMLLGPPFEPKGQAAFDKEKTRIEQMIRSELTKKPECLTEEEWLEYTKECLPFGNTNLWGWLFQRSSTGKEEFVAEIENKCLKIAAVSRRQFDAAMEKLG